MVHDYAPVYKVVERNCYWYCNMVFDACFLLLSPEKVVNKGNIKFNPHDTRMFYNINKIQARGQPQRKQALGECFLLFFLKLYTLESPVYAGIGLQLHIDNNTWH